MHTCFNCHHNFGSSFVCLFVLHWSQTGGMLAYAQSWNDGLLDMHLHSFLVGTSYTDTDTQGHRVFGSEAATSGQCICTWERSFRNG